MEKECQYCGKIFKHGISGNMIIFCPNCNKSTGSISDYGFGPITPCDIYYGERIIGTITGRVADYKLVSDYLNISQKLNGEYRNLSVYHEAEKIIENYLQRLIS